MSERPEISIVFPALNEAEGLPLLFEKTVRALEATGHTGEIILVDDGSTDDTPEAAERERAKIPILRVVRHRRNLGLTKALMTGFEAARGDVIVFLCSDLQSDPEEDIPKLLAEIESGNDVALGWRQGRQDGRAFVSKLYHWLSRLLFGIMAHDMNWIKAFRREVVENMKLRSDWHRYIAVLAASEGYKISEVKTQCHPRRHGKSRFSRRRVFAGFFDLLAVKFQVSFANRPMFFFGSAGLALLTLASLIGLYGVSRYVIEEFIIPGGEYKPRNVTYFAFIAFLFGGLGLFALGFLSELLVSIRDELRDLADRGKQE